MKQVLDFLNGSKIFYMATTDGQKPHVRPLGFVMESGGKLIFCTSNQKEMYKQLKANPNVEISCVDADMNTLRICGKAAFITTEELQKQALEVMPTLSAMYQVGDGKFELFCLQHAKAVCSTITGECKELPL